MSASPGAWRSWQNGALAIPSPHKLLTVPLLGALSTPEEGTELLHQGQARPHHVITLKKKNTQDTQALGKARFEHANCVTQKAV